MKIEEVMEIVLANEAEFLNPEIAAEAITYGIAALLSAGASYDQALTILERAQISLSRQKNQLLSFPGGTILDIGQE